MGAGIRGPPRGSESRDRSRGLVSRSCVVGNPSGSGVLIPRLGVPRCGVRAVCPSEGGSSRWGVRVHVVVPSAGPRQRSASARGGRLAADVADSGLGGRGAGFEPRSQSGSGTGLRCDWGRGWWGGSRVRVRFQGERRGSGSGRLPGIRARVVVPSQDWTLWKVLVPSQVWVGSLTRRSGLGFGVRVGDPSQKLERRFLVGVGILSHSPLGVGVWNHGSKQGRGVRNGSLGHAQDWSRRLELRLSVWTVVGDSLGVGFPQAPTRVLSIANCLFCETGVSAFFPQDGSAGGRHELLHARALPRRRATRDRRTLLAQ
ncbi:uncharacterized protein LOC125110225 isoform X2 [Lutra lutra]|uniref:uncharacterized protein LOC125110225 isoform X1 n=1 Tax=Lutra lutra TaxID=9657 RepID=UPI001FD290E4|nr:uncharacterized protein LOC125110225 isoform X1 [Lutra lutra]XP_047603216.1 uncharacterized protein LOC125110225 isoform X2 [Lutra lutra]